MGSPVERAFVGGGVKSGQPTFRKALLRSKKTQAVKNANSPDISYSYIDDSGVLLKLLYYVLLSISSSSSISS